MAENNTFQLTGNFKDNITPSLKKLNTQLAATTKSFEKMQKMVRPIAKDMAIMGDAASRMTQGMGGQRNVFESNLRAMKDYRSELGKISSAQRQMERKFKAPAAPFAPSSLPPAGGGGGRGGGGGGPKPFVPQSMGDGFTIEKGVVANLATNFITGIFDQISGAVGKSLNFVKNAFSERVEDEMSDIQSAGGIFSIGKDKKVAWADTYEEAMEIQESLNAEMASLAAALPGETGQYVQNMKQVTDTTMKIVNANGPAMIQAMKAFNSSVSNEKDAYVEATKQLAKYTTLGSIGQSGGVPLTALAEQLLNSDKVNIDSLKRTYAALEKNALVSGALKDFEGKMNKAAAGSADRYKAMIEAFNKAFPPEVIAAMNNSVDGTFQALKSYLMDPDIGLLGLGRKMTMDFSDVGRTLGPKVAKDITVFKMFSKFFGTFGMILGPILAEMPKLLDPLKNMLTPLKKAFVIAENAQKAILDATAGFAKKGLDFAPLRGALKGIESIARQFGGGDAKEMAKLDQMLNAKKLDLGGAIQQAVKVLFSSDALTSIGKSFGEALAGFLNTMAGIAEQGGALAGESGVISGFLEGWRKNKGTEALMKVISNIMGAVVKGLSAAALTIIAADPINAAIIGTVFFAPVRGFVFKMLGMLATQIGTAIMGTQLAGTITATIAGWAGAIVPTLAGIGTTIVTTVAGWAGAIVPALSAMGTGLMTFFTVTLPAVLAPLLVPALIVGAIVGLIALIYKFKDQINGAITALQGFIAQNFSGGLRDMLLGITNMWKGLLQMVTGLVDTVVGFFTGDKDRTAKGLQSIRDGARKWLSGLKQAAVGYFTMITDGVKNIGTSVLNVLKSAGQKVQQFFAPLTNWLNTYLFEPLGLVFQAIGMRITQGFQAFIGFITTYITTPVQNALMFVGSTIVRAFQAYVGFVQTYIVTPVQNALTFIGSAIAQGFQALLGLVQTYVVIPVQTAFTVIGSALAQGFYALVGLVQTYIIAPLQSVFAQIQAGISGAVSAIMSAWQSFVSLLVGAFKNLGSIAGQVGSVISSAAMSGIQGLGNAIKGALLNAASWISGGAIKPPNQPSPKPSRGGRAYDGNGARRMGLGAAISSEMRNKPSGSHLVIANSSETIIPAAGGYGAGEFMETLKQGFSVSQMAFEKIAMGVNLNKQNMTQGFQKDAERSNQTNQKIDKYQSTTASQITNISTNVAALAAQVKQMGAMGMMGGMGGGGEGGGAIGGAGTGTGPGYGSAGSKIAGQLGTYIKQTGGAPGSIHEHPQHGGVRGKHSPNSYHYQGRAIDIGAYANEQAGVMARIAQFNAKNGVKPVEWLHAKNAGGHNDHVHVAYNQGNIAPLLDELSKMPSGAKLAAANTSEFVANKDQTRILAQALQSKVSQPSSFAFGPSQVQMLAQALKPPVSASPQPSKLSTTGMTPGGDRAASSSGPISINAPITITQQPGQDPEQLAMMVAEKIGEAVADARLASILV